MGDVIDFSQVAAHKKRGQGSGEAPTYGEELHRTVELPFGNGEVRLDVEADGRVHMAVTVHAAHVPAALQDARRALARSLNVDSRDEAQMKRLRDQLGEEGYEAFFPGYPPAAVPRPGVRGDGRGALPAARRRAGADARGGRGLRLRG